MLASDRDKVTFLCMKRMAEKRDIIVSGTTLHDGNQSCCARYSSERERRSSGFSPMAPLGGRAAEMAGRRRSTVAAGGAPMARWFRARGGEIRVEVGAVDNGGALGAFYRVMVGAVEGREAVAVELQWRRLREMETVKGR
jgi:hypothetical protein